MMHNHKKGIIEIQFHWIFLLVAGMLLFLFIISIIFVQKGQAEGTFSLEVLRQITASFKSKQQISNSFTEMEIPNTKMYFDCDRNDLTFNYHIEKSQRDILPIEIMFTPRELSGRKILIWTQDFQMPFTVTRFVYLTTPDTAFIIYNESGHNDAKTLYDSFPANVTKFMTKDIRSITSQYKKYKIICFGGDLGNNCPNPNNYDYIRINKNSTSLYSYGFISYFQRGTPTQSAPYMSKSMLFGAIFSDNKDFYDCQMFRAFQQFELKRGLHLNRTKILESVLASDNPSCYPVIARPSSTLIRMKDLTHYNDTLLHYAKRLESDNYDLDVKGCPLVY